MNPAIDLSVIIPCFNDGRFLPEAVESVEANTRGRHEIIIVNDGSKDRDTLEILKSVEARGHRVIHQSNHGLGFSRNVGIAAAKGDYVLPLDADNRIRPAYIDYGIDLLSREPAVDVVYGDAEYFGEKTGWWNVPNFSLSRMLSFNFIDACAVVRKTAWERVGGYDVNMPVQGYEDWDFWLRVALTGGEFRHIEKVLFDYRVRSGSMSSDMAKMGNTEAAIQHIHHKIVPMQIGAIAEIHHSWHTVVDCFKQAPLRTLARLIQRSYFPRPAVVSSAEKMKRSQDVQPHVPA